MAEDLRSEILEVKIRRKKGMVTSGKEEMAHWSVYIKGIDFPQDKNGLMEAARRNNAPESFIEELQKLPEKTYHTAADVGREIGKQA